MLRKRPAWLFAQLEMGLLGVRQTATVQRGRHSVRCTGFAKKRHMSFNEFDNMNNQDRYEIRFDVLLLEISSHGIKY
jgi:hypothetical protein